MADGRHSENLFGISQHFPINTKFGTHCSLQVVVFLTVAFALPFLFNHLERLWLYPWFPFSLLFDRNSLISGIM